MITSKYLSSAASQACLDLGVDHADAKSFLLEMMNLNIIILHDPWRTANSGQVLLWSGARGGLLVPRIEHTIPLSILALLHDGAGIHESEEGSPLAAAGVAASDPLVRFLGRRGGRALLSPRRHRGETRLVSLIALQTTDPKA